MRIATLNIGKQITIIESVLGFAKVHSEKMGNFESIISKLDTIELVGLSKPTKKIKYEKMLLNNGFSANKIYWCDNAGFEGNNSDVLNYRIEYKKCE